MSTVVIVLYIDITLSYHLSQNRFSYSNASIFCNNQCQSDLLSLHSNTQYLNASKIISNSIDIESVFNFSDHKSLENDNVWIGLNRYYQPNFTWTDATLFDFAMNISGGVYPWKSEEPNNQYGNERCVHIWPRRNNQWNDAECSFRFRFMCNHCKGKLNKYLLIAYISRNWTDAETFCRDNLGTSLASIHSSDDQMEVATLCSFGSDDCWIGLTDINEENVFVWADDTYWDFGTNISGGIWPWAASDTSGGEPNDDQGGEDCVELRDAKAYHWNDQFCSRSNNFICNFPSELCFDQNWSILIGNLYWNINDNCTIHSDMESMSIIHDKVWSIDNNMWIVMDYMYTINSVYDIINGGNAGVVIFPFSSVCDYYYIGISIENGNSAVFVEKHVNNTDIVLYRLPMGFMYVYQRYYSLRVKLLYQTSSIVWNIDIGDFKLNFTDTLLLNYIGQSLYIGIRNDGMNISGKSLFISDPTDYILNGAKSWNECTLSPTVVPTGIPTTNPSKFPTIIPSGHPTMNPTANPSKFPTISPSGHPIMNPSTNPTFTPSNLPTNIPTISPLGSGQQIETTENNIVSTNGLNEEKIKNSGDLTELYIYFGIGIVILLVVIVILLILIMIYDKKKKALAKKPDKVVTNSKLLESVNDTLGKNTVITNTANIEMISAATTIGGVDIINNNNNDKIEVNDRNVDGQNEEDIEDMFESNQTLNTPGFTDNGFNA